MLQVRHLLLLCACVSPILAQDPSPGSTVWGSCAVNFSGTTMRTFVSASDSTNHATGNHGDGGGAQGSCIYSNPANIQSGAPVPAGATAPMCSVECSAQITTLSSETGVLFPLYGMIPQQHTVNIATTSGLADANGASITCGATMATAVMQCLYGTSCVGSASISVSASGVGASFSFPPTSIWNHTNIYTKGCAVQTVPMQTSGGGGGGGGGDPIPCEEVGVVITDPGDPDPGQPTPCYPVDVATQQGGAKVPTPTANVSSGLSKVPAPANTASKSTPAPQKIQPQGH